MGHRADVEAVTQSATMRPTEPAAPDMGVGPGQLEAELSADLMVEPNQRLRPRLWDDASLTAKLTLLMLGAAAVGLLLGEALVLIDGMWRVAWSLILLGTLGGMVAAGTRWVCGPLERVSRQAELLARGRRASLLRDLPLSRRDEAGRLAKVVHQLAAASIRDSHDAKQLRRTLDARVNKETRRATLTLERIAMRDPLTEVGNRRLLDDHLEPLVQAAVAAGHDVGCVVLDMDDFKLVNDTLGHDAGDQLLVLLSGLLLAAVRPDDLVIRLGGDEFAVLMPGANRQRGVELVQSVRRLFNQQVRTMFPHGPYADISAGLAGLSDDQLETGHQLLQHADARLYAAKRGGKGRTSWQEPVHIRDAA
jgi:diguanylate cyclase (GGDEF)-like protein